MTFWDHVDKTDTCWLWIGANSRGYGQVRWDGRIQQAHRVMWLITYGEWPTTPLDHICRNRACVNPDHLRAISQRENLLASPDTLATANVAKTHCPANHPYDEENTYVYRGRRICRECARARSREHQRRRRQGRDLTA